MALGDGLQLGPRRALAVEVDGQQRGGALGDLGGLGGRRVHERRAGVHVDEHRGRGGEAGTPSAVAQNVLAGMMTSSPGDLLVAISMSWMADVPEPTPSARPTPRYSASCPSKAATSAPDVYEPLVNTRSKAARKLVGDRLVDHAEVDERDRSGQGGSRHVTCLGVGVGSWSRRPPAA